MRLRVLTYNIHKGFAFFTRAYVLHELREAIRQLDADVVFLQEVMGAHPPSSSHGQGPHEFQSQCEFLAEEIWAHCVYGKNAVHSDGHHGNAVLSKFPIVHHGNIDVSNNRWERRGLLHVQITIPERPSVGPHLLCLHLDLFERGRRLQLKRLIEHARSQVPANSALIAAGDFNDWGRQFTDPLFTELRMNEVGVMTTGGHVSTFPSWLPLLPLDRIYVRGFRVLDHRVLWGQPWHRMSDHAAVLCELEFNDEFSHSDKF